MDDIDPAFNPCAEDTPGIASHLKLRWTPSHPAPNLSNCLGFSSLSVCTGRAWAPYIEGCREPLSSHESSCPDRAPSVGPCCLLRLLFWVFWVGCVSLSGFFLCA